MTLPESLTFWSALAALAQLIIVTGVIVRVILTRHPPGSAFAWILLTTILPYGGFLLYLVFGERPIGRLRARYLRAAGNMLERIGAHRLTPFGPLPRHLARHRTTLHLAARLAGIPITTGSKAELKRSSEETIASLHADIAAAERSIDMEFYIWDEGGEIREVVSALISAAKRGVRIRILVDDFGSREFLRSESRRELEAAGIEVASALPMRLLQFFGMQRADIRLHRKTVVIDGRIAYTGSFNMIDPKGYAEAATVGAWVDAMVRVEGPGALSLDAVWHFDWALQPDSDLADYERPPVEKPVPNTGNAVIATVPSGPYQTGDRNLLLILEAINRAEHTLTITTPYFIPTESVVCALINAVMRGVRVKLIVPETSDTAATGWAMRRYFDDLLQAGVEILFYKGGLLHTKSIAVDREFAVFGTLNIDNRSMHLNFELMMAIFDADFVNALHELHAEYETHCERVLPELWRKRPLMNRLKEGACYLISPLL
ncbi:cardiolipin synthase [Sutterella sp.]|uniref:cardiolipin synthase n=1 Tax=Sutterella sp. TaxID=1981025 RepID=UPI0026DEB20E|nr:cardiolipin synthase [Sutterella sp.]MDO5530504.1 cardiolipin synthase [Sutterella sp.]